MGLSLKLLGEFVLRDEHGATLLLPTRKTRALLGYLATHVDRPQPRERLMALLWSNFGEKQARHNLNQAVLSIRKLGLPLDSDGQRVTLHSESVEIDLARFRACLNSDPALAAKLYDGPFLDEIFVSDPAFDDWLSTTRNELHNQACSALERAVDAAADCGDTAAAVELAQRLVVLDPLREDGYRRLMRLMHHSGDRAGALRQFQVCADILMKELQIGPDSATKTLLEEIRNDNLSPTRLEVRPAFDSAPTEALRTLPDKPSIAVIPFANQSIDPDQEFFADGMTEDIITGLSRFPSLFVIARNSAFTYKGQTISAAKVATELGVRYLLEGSVRKAGERIRISAQLIDAEAGNHLWADRYDRQLLDIFAIQDDVTDAIVSAVAPEIGSAERKRALRRPTENLDAWGLYQRGLSAYYLPTPVSLRSAIQLFDKSIERDPNFSHAFAMAAEARSRLTRQDMDVDLHMFLGEALELSRKAVSLDPRDPLCLAVRGHVLSSSGQHDAAIMSLEEAVALNPNDVTAHHWLGRALTHSGKAEDALAHYDQALRMSPHDPYSASFHIMRGLSLAILHRYEECVQSARQATEGPNPPYWAFALLAGGLSKLGQMGECETVLHELFRRAPNFSLQHVRRLHESYESGNCKTWLELLRGAGMTEE